MARYLVVLILILVSTGNTFADGKRTKPQPLKGNYESFILLSAKASDLRLFLPSYAAHQPMKVLEWEQELNAYSQLWLAKKGKMTDQHFVKELFYDVHRRYLKNYTSFTGLQALLEKGEYNCLSASALYALLLDRLGYNYEIVESINHVVLLVKLQEGKLILLESTDPLNGCITEIGAIKQRLLSIRNSEQASGYYALNLKIFRSIDLRELAGLQYYNYAAWHYNNRNLANAAANLQKGQILYKSERFEKVALLMAGQ